MKKCLLHKYAHTLYSISNALAIAIKLKTYFENVFIAAAFEFFLLHSVELFVSFLTLVLNFDRTNLPLKIFNFYMLCVVVLA